MEKIGEQQAIEEGQAALAFLSSEAGQALVTRRNADYFAKWQVAKTSQDREAVYAEFKAFNTLIVDMEAMNSTGQMAQYQRDFKEKQAETEQKVYGRKAKV